MNDENLDIDGVCLMGFRMNPDSDEPEIYTLLTYGRDDIALNVNNELIFFNSQSQTIPAFSFFDKAIQAKAFPPKELYMICDVASALNILAHRDKDESAAILNCLNTIFDLLNSAKINLSDSKKKVLFALADHLTFDSDFKEFLNSKKINRDEILEYITWCIGAIVIKSKFI